MIKISSKDIQEASKKFETFLEKVVANYKKSELNVYRPDDKLLAKTHGFKYLGAGCYRIAFKYKNIVIKTHLHHDGSSDITEEHSLWNRNKRYLSSSILNPVLLCKTLKFKKEDLCISYSISPFVRTHKLATATEKHKKYKKFLSLVSDAIFDGHTGNIGVLNKLPILIDYQDGDVSFDHDDLDTNEINLFKKQRNKLLALVKKATA